MSSFLHHKTTEHMTKPKVLLRFDVEDYITTKSNHALEKVLEILDDLKITATFVLVGEKIRMLLKENNPVIFDFLQRHALGYHSNLHSFHPLANEYLQHKDWQSGIKEFLRREEPGYQLFIENFGRPPICYTQPGGDWVPQIYPALQQWKIPCFFSEDKNSWVTFVGQPFLVNGVLTLANKPTISDLVNLASSPGELEKAKNQFQTDYQETIKNGGDGLLFLACHPGRLVINGKKTWDELNFAQGKNTNPKDWSSPPLKSDADYQADLAALREFLIFLQDNYQFDWITTDNLVKNYQQKITQKMEKRKTPTQKPMSTDHHNQITREEIRTIAKNFTQEISYYILENAILSPIQGISVLCQFLLTKQQEGYLADSISIPDEIFLPEELPNTKTNSNIQKLAWLELIDGAKQILVQIKQEATFPAKVNISEDIWLELEQFSAGLATAVVQIIESESQPEMIKLSPTYLKTKDNVKKIDQINWNWPIFRDKFQNAEALNFTELLSWTIKPIK